MRSLAIALVLSSVSVARADVDQQTTNARIHLRAGIADYDEGRYAEAVGEMEAAYALRPLPDLQYNLAQCYERLNRLEDAAKAYEVYLTGKHDAQDRDAVAKRIENLRERAKAEAAGTAAPPKIEEKVVFKTIVVYRETPPPPGRVARAAAYGLAVLGVAGLATGIVFAVKTAQASSDVSSAGSTSSPPIFDSNLVAKQDAAHLYPIGTGVGFAVGALAIGGSVGLVLAARKLDRDAIKQREAEQAWVPTIAPFYARVGAATTTGLAVAGRF